MYKIFINYKAENEIKSKFDRDMSVYDRVNKDDKLVK